ncbi:tetratricopeptide repeat protein [Actinokineospora sp. 24-640]
MPSTRKFLAVVALGGGIALLGATVSALTDAPQAPAVPQTNQSAETSDLNRAISAAQDRLRTLPDDAATWALLGTAYVEQARVTGNPSYYAKADGALATAMEHEPDNAAALVGMGALANARHDFAAARDWGEKAREVAPGAAEVHGVLTDAYTQLGLTAAATEAVQRMLDIEPGVPSFTRAAYDLEQRGDTGTARQALERALTAATSTADRSFCHYQLGELAFDTGDLDAAAGHYGDGLRADPANPALRQGQAKTAAARGDLDTAVAGYQDVTARMPLPQYLHEYAVLLLAAERPDEARAQFAVLEQQRTLAEAAGAGDDLADSAVAADRGDAATALRLARAEWDRRQHVLVADALAWALHLSGEHTEALAYADRAAAGGWRNATFAYHRGMILAALDRDAEAAAELDRALATNPGFSPLHAPAARRALEDLR